MAIVILLSGGWVGWYFANVGQVGLTEPSVAVAKADMGLSSTKLPKTFDELRRFALNTFEAEGDLKRLVAQYPIDQIEVLLSESIPLCEQVGFQVSVNSLCERFAEEDNERSLRFALNVPAGPIQRGLIQSGFLSLARQNINVALQRALALENVRLSDLAMGQVVQHLGYQSPREALEYTRIYHGYISSEINQTIIDEWVSRDMTAATAYLWELDKDDYYQTRLHLFEAIVPHLIRHNREEALALWHHLVDVDISLARVHLFDDVVNAWAEFDYFAALEFSQNAFEGVGIYKREPLLNWIADDPDAAIDWVLQMEDKRKQMNWIEALSRYSFKGVPNATILSLMEQVPPHERYGYWDEVVRELGDDDFSSLIHWINQLPDSGGRNWGLWECVEHLRTINAGKMNLLKETFVWDSQQSLMNAFVKKWVKDELPGALTWIEAQAGEANYQDYLGVYASALADRTPHCCLFHNCQMLI